MADDEAILDDLLCRWHQWQQAERVGRGFNRRALVVGDYHVSRQYDDLSGALDADLNGMRMRQVDFEVSEMAPVHRVAIYCLARALSLGCAVFVSPRLPQDRAERERLVLDARYILTCRLLAAGVL